MADAVLLAARGPLDGRALPSGDEFSLVLAAPAARFVLRGDAAVADKAGSVFGAPPPLQPMRVGLNGRRFAMWLGPDEWLLGAPDEDAASLQTLLGAGLQGAPHSLVDVSQRQIGLEVFGPLAARALNAGCPLDLSPGAFPPGMAARTILGKCEVVLWRREPLRFHVEVWRSFADYATGFLIEAARRAPRA